MDAFVDTNKKIIQEAKTKVTELNINLEVMKNLKLELETNKDSTAQEIMNQLDTYLKAMWEAGQQLVEASNLNFDRSISSLSSAINYGTEIREKLDEMSSLSDDLYQSGDSSSRFFLARQCIGRLKNLLKTSDVRIPADDMISAKFVANDESLRNVSGELIGSVNTVEIRFPENFDSLVVEVPIETTTAHEIAVSPVTDLGSAETRTECAQKTVKSVAPLTEIQIEHENDIAVTSGEHISPASSLSIKTKEHVSSVAAMAGDCEITTDTGGAIQPDARQEPEPIENPESVVSEKVKREVKRQVGVQVEGIRRVEHVQTGRLGSNGTKKLSTHAKLTKTTRETHEQAEDFNFYVPSARDRNSMVQQSVREEMDLGASSGVEFQEPHGIAIATNGYVAIADTGRCEVKLFNRKNNLVRSFKIKRNIFSSSKCCPFDVSFIGVDKLVVTDSENDAVYICNLHGKISKQINDEKLKKPRGVVVDAQGRILVVDGGNRLLRAYNSITGDEIPEFGLNARADTDGAYLQEPWFISVDGANNVYVTDSSTSGIQIYDQNGHFIRRAYVKRSVYSEENISPRGIFVDKQGNICITRYDSGRVYVFNSDRRYLFEFGESWQNYYSLVVNTEGSWSAYITDKAGSSVYVFQNADEKS
uniref:Uncharacterized protein LOC102807065 n=1 Tax=Saccoglossus kowalevskii TaxID=10224 RepID=A0ABM0MFB8_SACKO|nr:PREDICTED: uncharacterized protein LOC102807065 [Saccoglossus kowalevskii]